MRGRQADVRSLLHAGKRRMTRSLREWVGYKVQAGLGLLKYLSSIHDLFGACKQGRKLAQALNVDTLATGGPFNVSESRDQLRCKTTKVPT